jgi:hypothetical protein
MVLAFFWLCTLIGIAIGALQFAAVMVGSGGAPQQAAGAAMALCWAVIPYVFTRAVEGFYTSDWRSKMLKIAQGPVVKKP